MAPAIFPCLFTTPLVVEPLLLEARSHSKVESGYGFKSIFISTKYAEADCSSHTFIPDVHVHKQLFAVLQQPALFNENFFISALRPYLGSLAWRS